MISSFSGPGHVLKNGESKEKSGSVAVPDLRTEIFTGEKLFTHTGAYIEMYVYCI